MTKRCPICKLTNPSDALRCDCGYDFATGEVPASAVHERRGYRWWVWVGIAIVLLGNALDAALWTWALLSSPPGDHARYIIEAGLSAMIAIATLVLGLSFAVPGLVRYGVRGVTIANLIFAFTPFPLGIAVMHILADYRNITLSP